MALKIFKNMTNVTLALVISVSLTACPNEPGPPPAAKHQPPTPEQTYLEHTISYSGETLAEIAAWYTGRGSNWTAIRDANPNIRPDRLRLGQMILIPKDLVTNDKPFSRRASKKKSTEPTPEVMATPASGEAAPPANEASSAAAVPTDAPASTPTDAPPLTPTDAAMVPTATAEPTVIPTAEPTVAPEATPKATSKDLEREKLLDELLK